MYPRYQFGSIESLKQVNVFFLTWVNCRAKKQLAFCDQLSPVSVNLLCSIVSIRDVHPSNMVNFIFYCYGAMAGSFFEKIWSGRPLESSFCFFANMNWWPSVWIVATWKLMFNKIYLKIINLRKIKPTSINRIFNLPKT